MTDVMRASRVVVTRSGQSAVATAIESAANQSSSFDRTTDSALLRKVMKADGSLPRISVRHACGCQDRGVNFRT